MSQATRAVLGGISADDLHIRAQLLTADSVVTVTSALGPSTRQALCHVFALHGHDACCPAAPQVHIDLLHRALAVNGACAEAIVVRPQQAPQFALRLRGAGGPRDIALGLLDAFAHLAAGRLPIELRWAEAPGA